MSDDTPRVWVGCLACYNAGNLIGEWVDGTEAADAPETSEVFAGCRAKLHEEFWCMDHENYGGLLDGECSPMEAQEIAEKIEALESWQPVEAVAAYLSNNGGTIVDLDMGDFEESYQGEWRSEEEYAESFVDDVYGIPGDAWWSSYFDYEKFANDLFMGDNWSSPAPGGVYVFRSY